MTSQRGRLLWFRASILVALGLLPASGCKVHVAPDCNDAKVGDNGLQQCDIVQVRSKPTTCSAPKVGHAGSCSSTGTDQCTKDSDCNSYKHGICNESCAC